MLVTIACSQRTAPEPIMPKATDTNVPVTSASIPWNLTRIREPNSYLSTNTITISLSADPTRNQEALLATTHFSVNLDTLPGRENISGVIDNFSISTGARIGVPDKIQLPAAFTGESINGQLKLQLVDQTNTRPACTDPAYSALSAVRRNFFIPPLQIFPRMTWMDSSSSETCHGFIPALLRTTYTYRVVAETEFKGTPAILVERSTNTSSTAEGAQNQHRILIRGDGSGTTQFYLDRTTGVLLGANSEQTTTLIITSSGRNQQFIQNSREILIRTNQ